MLVDANEFMREQSIRVGRISEKMSAATERQVVREYKTALADLKAKMAKIYEKYETGGVLSYNEMMKYNRMDAMTKDMNETLKDLTGKTSKETMDNTKGVFSESYYRAGYSMETGADAKLSFSTLNPKVIQAAVENPISGLTLSETLQANRASIITDIRSTITQSLIKGESYAKMTKRLQTSLENNAVKANRIVRTEGHRAAMQGNLAAMDHASSRGVEFKKEWMSVLDERTRESHQGMDGQIVGRNENFVSPLGNKAPAPGMFGVAAEDINCRCDVGNILPGAGTTTVRQTYREWAEEHRIKPAYEGADPNVWPAREKLPTLIRNTKTDLGEAAKDNSLGKYTDGSKLSAEREELHQKILEDLFKDAYPVTSGNPTFYMMGGGPASGKSSVIKAGNITLPKNVIAVDSDAIKARLPDYQSMVAAKNPMAASFVHEESSALAKRAMKIAQKNGYNSMLDGTGDGSIPSLMKKINQARSGGSQVVGYYVTCPTEEAVRRSAARAAKTGRVVMNDVITSTHKKVSQIMPECAQYFDRVELFDTMDGVRLVATGGSGKGLVAQPGMERLLREFIAKGGENG